MSVLLPAVVCMLALLALLARHLRQVRLSVGAADLQDVIIESGVTDRAELARAAPLTAPLGEGGRFDRAVIERLAIHPMTRLLEADVGQGLCFAVGLAGTVLALQHGQSPGEVQMLCVLALLYLGLAQLWRLALLLELREQQKDQETR